MTGDAPSTLAFQRLAAAVVVRACRDAQSGNGHAADARAWLAGGGADLADQLGLLPERVTAWVDALPILVQPALGL